MLKFDPAKRMTAREIEGHPWITGDVKVSAVKPNVLDLMRSYNAERRLKNIFLTVWAAIRFMSALTKDRKRTTPESSVSVSFLSLNDSSTTSNSSLAKCSLSQRGSLQKKFEPAVKTPTPSDKPKISIRKDSKPKLNEEPTKQGKNKILKDALASSTIPELQSKSKSNRLSRPSKDFSESISPLITKGAIPQLPSPTTTLQTVKAPSNRARNRKSVDLGPKIGELK